MVGWIIGLESDCFNYYHVFRIIDCKGYKKKKLSLELEIVKQEFVEGTTRDYSVLAIGL